MNRKLTRWQTGLLVAATLPMIGFGILGGIGTYANILSVLGRTATALGALAAGEGATAVLALVFVGLTMLRQSSPKAVRAGLWILPLIASGTGCVVASTVRDSVVYAVTPLAMCVSAEGLGLLARRVVIYLTGVDAEAQRRNAETMQRLAYLTARSKNHPDEKERTKAEKRLWKVAKKLGAGNESLGERLVSVQGDRMETGVDTALSLMFSGDVPLSLGKGTSAGQGVSPLALEEGDTSPQPEVLVSPQETRVPEAEPSETESVSRGQVLPIEPALSLSAYVQARAEQGVSRDTIRDEVRTGTYEGTWSESGLKKALQRYAPRSA